MLRLLPQPGEGQDPPRHRRGVPAASLSLTQDEARHLRASIRNVARQHYGTLSKLAAALGVKPNTLTDRRHPCPGLAIAVARVTGIPVEALLSGKLAAVPSPAQPDAPKDGAS
jgi:hypothetical protein